MQKKKIWGVPKNVFFAGLTSFFNDLSSEMILSIFPAFFKVVLKSGAASLGLVEGLAEAASNLFKIVSGSWSDRINKRKIFAVFGYALSTAIRPFYVGVNSVLHVIGLRMTDRIGKGLRDSPRDALISLSTTKDKLGKAFGFHRAMDTAGAVIGPLIAYLILRQFPDGFNTIFITAFVIGIFGVCSFLFVTDITIKVANRKKIKLELNLFSGRFKAYLFSVFVFSVGSLPLAVLLLRTQDANLTIVEIPLFYMIYNLAYAIFSPFAGKLADKIGDKLVLLSGYLLLLISYFVLGYTPSLFEIIAGFIILGLYSAFTDGVSRSYAGRLTNSEIRGTAFGFLNGVNGLGLLTSGIVGGYLWQRFGADTAFTFAAISVIIGFIVFVFTQKEKKI